jgi:hypothetical protein
MKSKLRVLIASSIVVAPFLGLLPGCTQPDNPTPKEAPPAPPPKTEELKVPKTSSGKGQYGASERYQKAMERMGKQQSGQ